MSYDQVPARERFTFEAATFGATTVSKRFIGPKGKRGIVRDIVVSVDVALVGTTTAPEVTVGATAGAVEYARFRLGTAAGTGYGVGAKRARALVTGNGGAQTFEDFAGHVKLETADIPADTEFFISGKAGTGGTPAGGGVISVDIDWV
jgi:hypothetical protein